MFDTAAVCAEFCRMGDSLDDIYIWLLMELQTLIGNLYEEGSNTDYRGSNEINLTLVALGLHRKIPSSAEVPFFLVELRKRTAVIVYACEINTATFLGRPPRLSYRHVALDPPLDLTDEQLVLNPTELEQVLAGLDATGNNTAGDFGGPTWLRTWVGLVPRNEDILDLALGDYTPLEILENAERIRNKTETYWNRLPPFIRNLRQENSYENQASLVEMLYAFRLRQGYLVSKLLLQMVLTRKADGDVQLLVDTACIILRDLLAIMQRRELFYKHGIDLSFSMAMHGLRCAAIIAGELLHQQEKMQLPAAARSGAPLLPRGETIQILTKFAMRLGEISPSTSVYSICQQGRKILERILDRALQPAITRPQDLPTSASAVSLPLVETSGARTSNFKGSTGALDCSQDNEYEEPMRIVDNDFMQWFEDTSFHFEDVITT
ncbi:hypothetical protein BX600DRAFT_470350 [Xylariales sp. PMI_506]|nr:hypothetical protein BX600DRAFT_470350 [Xylariales sp. PMI_506]